MEPGYPVRRAVLGSRGVEIECRDPELAAAVDTLLADVPAGETRGIGQFVVERTDGERRFRILRGGRVVYNGDSVGSILTFLVGEIIHELIDHNDRELLLHAGCVARGRFGILLPGGSGAGKSTLTAWLVRRGFDYLTDELVCLAPGTFDATAFTRPLNIKLFGLDSVRSEFGDAFDHPRVLRGGSSCLVPYDLLGAGKAPARTRIGAVVFPRFDANGDFELTPLSGAKTAMLLMQTFVNARNHSEHGFHQVTAFSRTVRGYMLQYACFSQLEAVERTLLKLASGQDAEPRAV